MAVVTFNSIPTKGTAGEMQLDKTNLAALVTANPYYSTQTNWRRIVLFYESVGGNQNHIVSFNPVQATPVSDFYASLTALDVFQIKYILIKDKDYGTYKIHRYELVPAEFDINL